MRDGAGELAATGNRAAGGQARPGGRWRPDARRAPRSVGLVVGFGAYHACFVTGIQLLTELGGAEPGQAYPCAFLLGGLLGALLLLAGALSPVATSGARIVLLAAAPSLFLVSLLGSSPGILLAFALLCGALLGMTHCLYGLAVLRAGKDAALPVMAWVTVFSAAAEMAYLAIGEAGGDMAPAWRAALALLLLVVGCGALGMPDLTVPRPAASWRGGPRQQPAAQPLPADGARRAGDAPEAARAATYARVIAAFVIVSLACRACDVYSLPQFTAHGLMSLALFASHVLAGLALLASVAVSREALLYRLALPMVGAGFVVMAVFAQAGLGYLLPVTLIGFGFELMNVFLFVFVLRVCEASPRPRRLVAGYVAAVYLSVLAGKLVSASLSASAATVSAVGLVCVVLLVLVALFVLPERVWAPFVSHADAEAAPTDAVEGLARRFGLTAREEDVLRLLLRGRTLKVIAEKLSISASTAGTHIASVYRKTGVHSQQELIDLFEEGGRDEDENAAG